MNLLAIFGSFRRYKRTAAPVILLTVIAMIYVVVVKPSLYASNAYVLLENPPSAPSIGQIDVNPKLANVNANNPLASLQNLVQVADVLSQLEGSPAETAKLEQEGASPGYAVASDSSLETPPVIDITGVGANRGAAIHSAQVITKDIQQQLYQLQVEQHVNRSYLITSIEYVRPTTATSSSSSKLRSAVVVLIIGLIVLLIAVSVSQSAEERKRRSAKHQRERPSSAPDERYRASNTASMPYEQAQPLPTPVSQYPAVNPRHLPDMQEAQGDRHWQ